MKKVEKDLMTITMLVCFTIFGFGFLSCSRTESRSQNPMPLKESTKTESSVNPLVDIPKLAHKSPEEIEKILGESLVTTKITDPPEQMPGELRHYLLPDLPKDSLQVRFYKTEAVFFTLTVPKEKQRKNAQELVALAGITVDKGKEISPEATEWKGKFNGIDFARILAIKSPPDDYHALLIRVK